MLINKKSSSLNFAIFRILLGLYLSIYTLRALPFVIEMYSYEGIIGSPKLNWTYGYFPNIFLVNDSPEFVFFCAIVMLFLSFLITVGFYRRLSCLLLWFIWACFFGRNNLTQNPGFAYIGWLLLALSLVPTGEPFSFSNEKKSWEMPKIISIGCWIVLGVSYSFSGYTKLISSSWQTGKAMYFIYSSPMAYNNFFCEFMLWMPIVFLKLQTWLALFFELLALPIFFISFRARIWGFFVLTIMHFIVIATLDLLDVSISILLFHLFAFGCCNNFDKEIKAG